MFIFRKNWRENFVNTCFFITQVSLCNLTKSHWEVAEFLLVSIFIRNASYQRTGAEISLDFVLSARIHAIKHSSRGGHDLDDLGCDLDWISDITRRYFHPFFLMLLKGVLYLIRRNYHHTWRWSGVDLLKCH